MSASATGASATTPSHTHGAHVSADYRRPQVHATALLSTQRRLPVYSEASAARHAGILVAIVVSVVTAAAIGLVVVFFAKHTLPSIVGSGCNCAKGTVCTTAKSGPPCLQCNVSGDCSGTDVCLHGVCRAACATSLTCPSAAGICLTGACVPCVRDGESEDCVRCVNNACVECIVDPDCGGGRKCVHGACALACGAECPVGTHCDVESQACVGCTEDSQCAGVAGDAGFCTQSKQCVQCLTHADCAKAANSMTCSFSGQCVALRCGVPPTGLHRSNFMLRAGQLCLFPSSASADGKLMVGTTCTFGTAAWKWNDATGFLELSPTGGADTRVFVRALTSVAADATEVPVQTTLTDAFAAVIRFAVLADLSATEIMTDVGTDTFVLTHRGKGTQASWRRWTQSVAGGAPSLISFEYPHSFSACPQ